MIEVSMECPGGTAPSVSAKRIRTVSGKFADCVTQADHTPREIRPENAHAGCKGARPPRRRAGKKMLSTAQSEHGRLGSNLAEPEPEPAQPESIDLLDEDTAEDMFLHRG